MKIGYKELKILSLQILTGITFSSAFIIPFYFSGGVLSTDVFLLFGIYQIGVLLFEIPTGIFSSKFGEKIGLSVGYIFMFLFFVLLSLGEGFLYFALLQFILAISKAFQSGSINSLIYDFALENKLNHKRLRANYQIIGLVIGLLTTLAGSFLALKLGYTLIFYIEALLFLIASVYILSFKVKETYKLKNKKAILIFKDSITFLKCNRDIMFSGFLLYFLLGLEAGIYISIQDTYLNSLDLPLEYLGGILALLTIVSIIFTKIISKKDYIYIYKYVTFIIIINFYIIILIKLLFYFNNSIYNFFYYTNCEMNKYTYGG